MRRFPGRSSAGASRPCLNLRSQEGLRTLSLLHLAGWNSGSGRQSDFCLFACPVTFANHEFMPNREKVNKTKRKNAPTASLLRVSHCLFSHYFFLFIFAFIKKGSYRDIYLLLLYSLKNMFQTLSHIMEHPASTPFVIVALEIANLNDLFVIYLGCLKCFIAVRDAFDEHRYPSRVISLT